MKQKENLKLLTGIPMAVAFLNAFLGSVAFVRVRRIDYRSGLLFSAATVPSSILGALPTAYISHRLFNVVFGLLMIATSVFLLMCPNRKSELKEETPNHHLTRSLIDTSGVNYTYSYNPAVGMGLSLFVGYISSLFSIGGGIIHVPVLAHILNFPVHIATATSHFILAFMTMTGTTVHMATGVFSHGLRRTISLAIGMFLGAQLDARVSIHVHENWITQGLAIALGFVGIQILLMAV